MANLLPAISFETGWVRGYLKYDGDIGYDVNDDMTSPFVAVNGNDSYTFSVNYDLPSPHPGWIALVQYDDGKRKIGSRYTSESSSSSLPNSISLTTLTDCKYIRVTSSNLENNNSATASLEGNIPEPTWIVGEDGYPTPANSEAVLPDYTFVKPLPRLLWHCSEPTKDIFNALPNKALTEPLPDGMWRITKYVENGYPYNNLMPDLQYAEPVYKYEAIRLLDNVRVVSYPHGLNRLFPVTKMEIPLDKPENTTYTLNFKKSNTLTGNIAKTNMDTWRQLREQPTLTTMLASAQANATQLITSAMGGYVTLVHNEEGIITEIVIADEADYLQAQNIWRWNTGGLGFSSHGYQGPYEAAITMDGSIVASMITAGTMYADRIHGGILTMGGVDNVNGIIQVRKGNGDLACKFDKDGGWIHGRLYTEDDNDNWMNVIDGYIYGGNGSNTYATIDIANEYDIGESDTRGLGFIAPIIGLNCKHLLISDNGRDLYKAKTQTVRVVSDISVDSDGKVTSITKKDLQFKNGILVSVDNV